MADGARDRLIRSTEALEEALRDVDGGYISLAAQDAQWLAEAFRAYLDGETKSLDHAFRVKPGRGAPKQGPSTNEIMELVKKAMWRGRKSWNDIAAETNRDPRDLQRLVKRHKHAAIEKMANELAARMRDRSD